MPKASPKVLLGVTGSIAAYKAAELARLMQKKGWDVWVVMTTCATQYVGPLTFRALTGHPVPHGGFAELEQETYTHLGLAEGAAAMIVASEEAVKKHGLTPRARILGMASAAVPAIGSKWARAATTR